MKGAWLYVRISALAFGGFGYTLDDLEKLP